VARTVAVEGVVVALGPAERLAVETSRLGAAVCAEGLAAVEAVDAQVSPTRAGCFAPTELLTCLAACRRPREESPPVVERLMLPVLMLPVLMFVLRSTLMLVLRLMLMFALPP
jgi:hypothetical protein